MPPYQLLASIGLLLALAELLVSGFFMLPLGVAFLLTAVVAFWIDSWNILLPVLALFEFLSFISLRKWFHSTPNPTPTNVDAMLGQECEVIEPIGPDSSGYVKLFGDHWAARSASETEITKGSRVVITRIDGNKVWVKPSTK
jgi:membrane protein implicated in regulation of membrane protease activity